MFLSTMIRCFTDFINPKIKSIQSFRNTLRDSKCVDVFICMDMWGWHKKLINWLFARTSNESPNNNAGKTSLACSSLSILLNKLKKGCWLFTFYSCKKIVENAQFEHFPYPAVMWNPSFIWFRTGRYMSEMWCETASSKIPSWWRHQQFSMIVHMNASGPWKFNPSWTKFRVVNCPLLGRSQ
jgi:hypothetical protein